MGLEIRRQDSINEIEHTDLKKARQERIEIEKKAVEQNKKTETELQKATQLNKARHEKINNNVHDARLFLDSILSK